MCSVKSLENWQLAVSAENRESAALPISTPITPPPSRDGGKCSEKYLWSCTRRLQWILLAWAFRDARYMVPRY